MSPLSSGWVLIPGALAAVLALARLARERPGLRPLVLPFALSAAAFAGLRLGGGTWSSGWPALILLLPVLVLLVRSSVLMLQMLFRRSGQPAPVLLESVLAVLLYVVGAGVIAHYWLGVELTPFLATSAVVGAVVGLALQDTLGNLFSGIALHGEAPFRVGDWIRIGGQEGCVEQLSWRAMRLRTWEGDTLTLPNNEVARHGILNFSQPRVPHSRVLQIGVNYQTPPNKVLSVLANLLAQVEGLAAREPQLRLVGYLDFAIQYEVRYFLDSYGDYRRVEGEILRLIWYHFRRHGIEIPFPIRNVYLHQAEPAVEAKEARLSRLGRALRTIDLFRPLSDEELAAVLARFRHLHYARGEKIIEEGTPGDSFFVIDRGEVEVSKSLEGSRRALARLMEGQFFGEMALLTGEPRAASVLAATDVDLFMIDKGAFHDLLASNPEIAVDISTILAERRDALNRVQGDLTARYETAGSPAELKERILDRIRSFFGL